MSQVPPAWSFSSLKLFQTCPKKYEAEKVTKEVKFTETEATLYGTQAGGEGAAGERGKAPHLARQI